MYMQRKRYFRSLKNKKTINKNIRYLDIFFTNFNYCGDFCVHKALI